MARNGVHMTSSKNNFLQVKTKHQTKPDNNNVGRCHVLLPPSKEESNSKKRSTNPIAVAYADEIKQVCLDDYNEQVVITEPGKGRLVVVSLAFLRRGRVAWQLLNNKLYIEPGEKRPPGTLESFGLFYADHGNP